MSRSSEQPDDQAALGAALVRLERARLTSAEWDRVETAVRELRSTVRSGDRHPSDAATTTLVNLAFGARVRQRLDHPRPRAPVVAPTKPSRALPVVGAVCASLLLALGWALGGGVVLIGTALFATLILVVAVTGTTGFAARRAAAATRDTADAVAPPPDLAGELAELRSALGD